MGINQERLASLVSACTHLPSRLPTLFHRLADGNPAIVKWVNAIQAAGHTPTLIVQIGRLGDIVACTPVARQLKAQNPNAKLAWVCSARYAGVFDGNPSVDAVFHEESLASWLLVKRLLPRPYQCYELVLDTQRCTWTGIKLPGRNSGITNANHLEPGSNLLLAYGRAAGIRQIEDVEPDLFPRPGANQLLPPLGEARVMALHFDSDDPDRALAVDAAIAYAQRAQSLGWHLLELGLRPIVSRQIPGITFPGPTVSFPEQLALLRSCTHFTGVDSAFMHCANALRMSATIFLGSFRHYDRPRTFSGTHWKSDWDCIYGSWSARKCPASIAISHVPALPKSYSTGCAPRW